MKNGADFILSGTLKGVALKDTKKEDLMQLVLRFEEDVGAEEARQLLRTGVVFADRTCDLEVSGVMSPHNRVHGWIAGVRARTDDEKGVIVGWTLNANVELVELPGMLEAYLPRRGGYLSTSGRLPQKQLELAEITHDTARQIEAGLKAKGHDVTVEVVEVVRPDGEAA